MGLERCLDQRFKLVEVVKLGFTYLLHQGMSRIEQRAGSAPEIGAQQLLFGLVVQAYLIFLTLLEDLLAVPGQEPILIDLLVILGKAVCHHLA